MYIEYLDFSNGTNEVAYLVRIDEKYASIIEPFTYEFLRLRNLEHWLKRIRTNEIHAEFFQYKKIEYNYQFSKLSLVELTKNYPLNENDIADFYGLSLFFKQFIFSRETEASSRMIDSFRYSYFYLSLYQRKKIYNYLFSQFYKKSERLPAIVNSEITKYINHP